MSEETVEIVRAAYNAFERGDLEGVSQLQAPTIEWQTSVEDPDAATQTFDRSNTFGPGPTGLRLVFTCHDSPLHVTRSG